MTVDEKIPAKATETTKTTETTKETETEKKPGDVADVSDYDN